MAHCTAETFDEDNFVWQSIGFPLQSHPGLLPSSYVPSSAPTNYFGNRGTWGIPHSLYATGNTVQRNIWITYDEPTGNNKSTRPANTEVMGYELYEHKMGFITAKRLKLGGVLYVCVCVRACVGVSTAIMNKQTHTHTQTPIRLSRGARAQLWTGSQDNPSH